MNKRTVLASLNKIANELDNNGLHNEADTVTKVMSRLAMDENDEYGSMEDMGYCPECHEFSLIDGKCEQCGHGEDDDSNASEYEEAYFKQNPDAPRTYEEAYFKQNPDAPRLMNPDAPRTMKPDAPRQMKPETREESFQRAYLSEGRNYS